MTAHNLKGEREPRTTHVLYARTYIGTAQGEGLYLPDGRLLKNVVLHSFLNSRTAEKQQQQSSA